MNRRVYQFLLALSLFGCAVLTLILVGADLYFIINLPDLLSNFRSPRVMLVVACFITAPMLAIYHTGVGIWSAIESKAEFFRLDETPNILSRSIEDSKEKHGLTNDILVQQSLTEIGIKNLDGFFILYVPLFQMMLFQEKHWRIALDHELLHVKHGDTQQVWFSEQLSVFLKGCLERMEQYGMAVLNPLYWGFRSIRYLADKIYVSRDDHAEQLIDEQLIKTYGDKYIETLTLSMTAIEVYERLKLKGIHEENLHMAFLKTIGEDFLTILNSVSNQVTDRLEQEIDVEKVKVLQADSLYHSEDVQVFFMNMELPFTIQHMAIGKKEIHEGNYQEEELEEHQNNSSEINSEIINPTLQVRLMDFCKEYGLPEPSFTSIEIGRKAHKIFQADTSLHDSFIFLITSPDTDEKCLEEWLTAIGIEARQPFQKRRISRVFVFDEEDREPFYRKMFKRHNLYPNLFLWVLAVVTSNLPFATRCGGVIPFFISTESGHISYGRPKFSPYWILAIGHAEEWRDTDKQLTSEKVEIQDNDTEPIRRGKFWIRKRAIVLIVLYSAIILYFAEVEMELALPIVGGITAIFGMMMFAMHHPKLWNNIKFLSSFGRQSFRFNNPEDFNAFAEQLKASALASKAVCFLIMAIGVVMIVIGFATF